MWRCIRVVAIGLALTVEVAWGAGGVRGAGISGLYVASTQFGNIFCLEIVQEGERITGTFDEVDFRQVVPLQGLYRAGMLRFQVEFRVNGRPLGLMMQARKVQEAPLLFHGDYRIGAERGNFVLYAIQAKPPVCRRLHAR